MVYSLIKEARDTATDKKQQEEMEIDARDTMGVAYAGRFLWSFFAWSHIDIFFLSRV